MLIALAPGGSEAYFAELGVNWRGVGHLRPSTIQLEQQHPAASTGADQRRDQPDAIVEAWR